MKKYIMKITTYRGFIVTEPFVDNDDNLVLPDGHNIIGTMVIDTENNLGMSSEAWEIIKKMERSGDDIGDFNAYHRDDNKDCVSWLGGPRKVVSPLSDLPYCGVPDDLKFIEIPDETNPEIIENYLGWINDELIEETKQKLKIQRKYERIELYKS